MPVAPAIDESMYEAAVRAGNESVSNAIQVSTAAIAQSNKYMSINRKLIDNVRIALAFIETGRVTEGRDQLRKALADTARALL